MSTVVIVGAGPGLGAAVAERFGREGLAVALVTRNQVKLDQLAESLSVQGITTKAYAADVHDRDGLSRALAAPTATTPNQPTTGPPRSLVRSP